MAGKSGKRDTGKGSGADSRTTFNFKLTHIKNIFKNKTHMRISKDALIAASVAANYLFDEMLVSGRDITVDEKKKKMSPRHIQRAINNDPELKIFFTKYQIQSGGVKHTTDISKISQRR